MEKENRNYDVIKKLVSLATCCDYELDYHYGLIDTYEIKGKYYDVYLGYRLGAIILIKNENDVLEFVMKDDAYTEYDLGPLIDFLKIQLNIYKLENENDFKELFLRFGILEDDENYNFDVKSIIDVNLKIQRLVKFAKNREKFEKKYVFNEKCDLVSELDKITEIPKLEGKFSDEVILNIINQVYESIERYVMDKKIQNIIDELSEEELVILREKLADKDAKALKKIK